MLISLFALALAGESAPLPAERSDAIVVRAAPSVAAHLPPEAQGETRSLAAGYTLVSWPGASRAERDARLALWLGEDDVEFAGPVLEGHFDGGFGAPTPTLLVRGRDGDLSAAWSAVAEWLPLGVQVVPEPAGLRGALRLELPLRDGRQVLEVAAELARDPRLEWAEPDWLIAGRSAGAPPNDPLFAQQWDLLNTGQTGGLQGVDLHILPAWDRTTGSTQVPVLVIDVGVELSHPDLLLGPAVDLTGEGTGGAAGNACDHHGTWVAGCVSALRDNGLGLAGVAPGCPVLSARALVSEVPLGFCNGSWTTLASWTADALDFGAQQGARVTVNSNSYGFSAQIIEDRYAQALGEGQIHFASAGNSGAQTLSYPASLPTVTSVGAVDAAGLKASFSNGGPELDLTGPGVEVPTTDRLGTAGGNPFGDYHVVDGTSFSAPLVAGVAALALSLDGALSPAEVGFLLAATATDLGLPGRDDAFGFGLVNADAALAVAAGEADALLAQPSAISLSSGGAQVLLLDGGDTAPGDLYLVLGSGSGTAPGVVVDGFLIGLVPDNWLALSVQSANSGLFGSTLGTLDGSGRNAATLTFPGSLPPVLVGLVLHHTFVRFDFAPFPVLATQPPAAEPLRFVP
jgi:subtilisin family serine protease